MPEAVDGVCEVRGEDVRAVPDPVPAGDYSPLTRELARAVRWAEAERDAAAGRMTEATGQAGAAAGAWRGYLWGLASHERERAAWCDDLARWLGDELGKRVAAETRARVMAEALGFLERAA